MYLCFISFSPPQISIDNQFIIWYDFEIEFDDAADNQSGDLLMLGSGMYLLHDVKHALNIESYLELSLAWTCIVMLSNYELPPAGVRGRVGISFKSRVIVLPIFITTTRITTVLHELSGN